MYTNITVENSVMTVAVDGEINTNTAPQLAKEVENLDGISSLIFDLALVPYVSSAGLRLFLTCQRKMSACGGDLIIRNCNDFMMEIFEGVGYHRILKIERKG